MGYSQERATEPSLAAGTVRRTRDFLARNDHVRILVFWDPKKYVCARDRRKFRQLLWFSIDVLFPKSLPPKRGLLCLSQTNGPDAYCFGRGNPGGLLIDKRAPQSYLPQGSRHQIIYSNVSTTSQSKKSIRLREPYGRKSIRYSLSPVNSSWIVL